MIKYLSISMVPLIIGFIILYGMLHGVKVYECFVEGAKDGMRICMRIFPYLLAMIVAVSVFRESGAMNYFIKIVSPAANLIGLPPEVVPIVMVKPLSGSGALGIFTETIKKYGADSYIGRVSSIIMGTTETIFYTLTVYFGAVGIKKIRHTLWAAVLADITAIIAAVTVTRLFFNY